MWYIYSHNKNTCFYYAYKETVWLKNFKISFFLSFQTWKHITLVLFSLYSSIEVHINRVDPSIYKNHLMVSIFLSLGLYILKTPKNLTRFVNKPISTIVGVLDYIIPILNTITRITNIYCTNGLSTYTILSGEK